MKHTGKHKAYGAVVGIGLAWLVYDRMNGAGQPAESAAAALVVPAEERSTVPPAGAAQAVNSPAAAEVSSEVTLTEKLTALASSRTFDYENTRDAFAPSTAWVATRNTPSAQQADINAEDFIKKHRLMSVLKVGKTGAAQIDGRLLKIGEEI